MNKKSAAYGRTRDGHWQEMLRDVSLFQSGHIQNTPFCALWDHGLDMSRNRFPWTSGSNAGLLGLNAITGLL